MDRYEQRCHQVRVSAAKLPNASTSRTVAGNKTKTAANDQSQCEKPKRPMIRVFIVLRFLSSRNIAHVKTSVASPQSNGQIERVNRVIKVMLAKLLEAYGHIDGAEKLPQGEFAINNTGHCSTGHSPSEVLFGVEQRGHIVDEFAEHVLAYCRERTDIDIIRNEASEAIKKSQAVRDLVVLTNIDNTPGANKKLIPKYRGPYVIQKQLGNDRYEISDITQIPYVTIVV
ncbi:uncharacterized protein LOC142235355 [Haematobia irritans]|uniref:uncharacterized protein LOC142235355 n=1 Tax=Haematobia irritans TaxID=7368 RepID=UPI003F4F8763